MKFKFRKFDVQNELMNISTVVDRKNANPVLSCVYLALTDQSTLLLAASDGTLMVQTAVKVDGTSGELLTSASDFKFSRLEHSMALDPDKLIGLLKKLPDKVIELDYDHIGRKVVIRCDKSRFTLSCMEAELYPAIEKIEKYQYKIPLKFFYAAAKNSLTLIGAKEGAMIQFSGALISLEDRVLEVVAMDNPRMASWFTTLETEAKFNIVLPRKSLSEMSAVLEGITNIAAIDVSISKNHAYFSFGKYTYRSGILSGGYPNYRVLTNYVRTNNTSKFRMNRVKLEAAISRCLVVADKKEGSGINFEFSVSELILQAANTSGDVGVEIVEDTVSETSFKTRINGEYLLQYLASVQNDEIVEMFANTEEHLKPVYFRGQSDRNYMMLIQPMERL